MARGISAEAREDILVQAFLTCPNISEISKKTKIPRPTIYTVIHTDSFQRKYSEARNEAVIRKLAEKHPEDCQIIADNEDGSICAHVPVSWLRISPPKQYTEEQRQQMGERMRRNVSENKGVQE